ncbi:AN1-type zinc finger protein 4 isoform X2 [Fukomys damarensis]|uniref:AN1-type zinc finger protein 4 isoform X2 n=1 Tax=Fukomys damarensis TaxID=885580 RepID=UPI00053FF6C4|nr:AN1-type zinc finger protein 4 isoform X2 [Fukomys damarensis]
MCKVDSDRTEVQLPATYSRGFGEVKVMDNRKEPPFFNEDNMELGPLDYKHLFYDTMELFIETLTGTCFKLRVSPFEAVISIKAKIQRLEGIPICQQHLIWNNVELEDDYCLNDYNISEGCTLKLVLAMRGGPINTRKVPMEDPLREMAEYMDPSRDEVWEKASCSRQVTFLVYREGDQLNFFCVVDRGNGTLTPLSESLSGGSVYNLCTDEDEEMEPSPGKNTIENSITMNKMKLLKAKMESMNLGRKPKRAPKVQPRPPNARPASGSGGVTPRPRLLPALMPLSKGTSGHLWPGSSQPQGTQHSMGNLATEDLHDPVLSIPPHKEHKPKAVLCPAEAEGNVVRTGGGAGTQGMRRTSASSLLSSPASSGAAVHSSGNRGAPGKPHQQPRSWNSKADPEPAIPSPSSQGKRPEIISRVEAMTDKASKEPLGHSALGLGMNRNIAAAGKRGGECTHHLPPVKAPLQAKKKTTAKHCFLCGKKTGLATSYECRCGNNFCSSHRYAETHGCTYDYKSAGRRFLQEANPVVKAPKLPKI